MTKEIVIDDIDVSECVFLINGMDCSSMDCDCIKCVHNTCYFKQFKRAEQKLEKIKNIVVPIKENTCFGQYCGAIDWILKIIEGEENG